jgi:hypothetical protein
MVCAFQQRPYCASGGIWRGLFIINCLRGTWPSLLNAIVNNFACWRKQSSKNARVDDIEWFFSMTTPDHTLQTRRKRPFRNSTGRLFNIHPTLRTLPHRITTSSALSPTIFAEFPSTTTLSSKIGSKTSSRPNRRISSSVGSKSCPNVGRQWWIMEENT